MQIISTTKAQPGDVVELLGHRVGEARQRGTIIEVLGEEGHPHFTVRWDDGHRSHLFANADIVCSRPAPARGAKR